ncbi:MAG: hypothetical protein DMG56_29205 [Acidobacteria bacterium]|nr:MAG: hypothetical protein DMG56_29205 [Acidobacteriota bacterium]
MPTATTLPCRSIAIPGRCRSYFLRMTPTCSTTPPSFCSVQTMAAIPGKPSARTLPATTNRSSRTRAAPSRKTRPVLSSMI